MCFRLHGNAHFAPERSRVEILMVPLNFHVALGEFEAVLLGTSISSPSKL